MDEKIDWQYLFTETRARVYLLWALLTIIGFVATHYYQRKTINAVWFTISAIGLGYMWKVMPLRVRQMRNIFMSWLIPIAVGMTVSGVVFYIDNSLTSQLIAHLGAFWLIIMAIGYVSNGIVDRPAKWYFFAAVINVVAGILCFVNDDFTRVQYLIAAIISGWSMLYLWLYRSYL